MLASIVIVSCVQDLAVNRISVPAVLENIPARNCSVIVPSGDVAAFRGALSSEVTVISEEAILTSWSIKQVRRALPPSVSARAGWYLQQFLKLEAVRQLPADSEALIWDGDTVPLRRICFKDSRNRIGFYVGLEHHQPYFDTTQRLLGMARTAPYSFIAQCMCVKVPWITALLLSIEKRVGKPWVEAILSSVPGASQSEFSEYETIGTYVMTAHPGEMFLSARPWFRWGMGLFGGIDNVTASGLLKLSRHYDYVALERWDRGTRAWMRSRGYLLSRTIRSRGHGHSQAC
jgi:uncharacterized protein DUF6492